MRSTSVRVAAVLFMGCFVTASPAFAHDRLVDTSPAAKSVSSEELTKISLTFSANLMARGSALKVEVDGRPVDSAEPVVSGRKVSTELATPVTSGKVIVVWRVVSSDGHPITGKYSFTVDGPAPSNEPIVASASSDVSASSGVTSSSSATGSVDDKSAAAQSAVVAESTTLPSATPTATGGRSASDGQDTTSVASPAVVTTGAVAVAAGAGGFWWWRRRR